MGVVRTMKISLQGGKEEKSKISQVKKGVPTKNIRKGKSDEKVFTAETISKSSKPEETHN